MAILAGFSMMNSQVYAEGFLFGDESKGLTLPANETDLNIRIRLQPRADYGDLIKSKDGKSYTSAQDIL